ncbi:hypothetical protein EY01_15535 [Staphylococcus aureus]|nr:hypothetical protein EY01_15535 [Staphylococcus aureus]
MMMKFYSIERSREIAKQRGIKYQDFEKSDYANGKYYEFYTTQEVELQVKQVRKLLDGMAIPHSDDWNKLQQDFEQ